MVLKARCWPDAVCLRRDGPRAALRPDRSPVRAGRRREGRSRLRPVTGAGARRGAGAGPVATQDGNERANADGQRRGSRYRSAGGFGDADDACGADCWRAESVTRSLTVQKFRIFLRTVSGETL